MKSEVKFYTHRLISSSAVPKMEVYEVVIDGKSQAVIIPHITVMYRTQTAEGNFFWQHRQAEETREFEFVPYRIADSFNLIHLTQWVKMDIQTSIITLMNDIRECVGTMVSHTNWKGEPYDGDDPPLKEVKANWEGLHK